MKLIPSSLRDRIANRPNLLNVVDNIGWLFLDKILGTGLGLVMGIWIARYLGPEKFGLLSFATAFVGLFGAIAGLGLRGIVVRDIVRDPEIKEETLGTAALLQFIGGLIAYGLILAAILWLLPNDAFAKALIAILGSMMLFKASEVGSYWFESQMMSKYTVLAKNGSLLIFFSIKAALIFNNAPLASFAWAIAAEAFVFAMMLVLMLELRGPRLRHLRVRLSRAKGLLSQSWPLLLSGVLVSINLKFDQIMITTMVNGDANGKYAVAAALPQFVIGLLVLIETSLYPKNISDAAQGHESLMASLNKTATLIFYLSIAVTIPVIIFSDLIVAVLYGEDYVASVSVLNILVWLVPLSAIVRMQGQYCQITGKTILVMYRQLFIAGSNIFLNWLLIPIYGVIGSAYAILISFSLAIFISSLFDKEFGSIPIMIILKPNFSYMRLRK